MKYSSTRDFSREYTAAETIAAGLAPDGGLFLPRELPKLSSEELRALAPLPYPRRAAKVMKLFLDEFSAAELEQFCDEAYDESRFPGGTAPVVKRGDGLFLELWHGPTCAFKDMALQMLPRLLTASLRKIGQQEDALILTATSGDTGKAALEGFCGVENTKIMVFYPEDGVSRIQQLQMTTQRGSNVMVQAVRGNFDDAQTGVKQILADCTINESILEKKHRFSSANSINWGRLLPQIAYYVSAYLDCVGMSEINFGDELNFCVPTGNFGNILAAYLAKCIGVPIGRLICASNANNVLTDFIRTGRYDRNRPFHTTVSPSMDILISSNLERLLCLLSGDTVKVSAFMEQLSNDGYYNVGERRLEQISELFWADFCDDIETFGTIRNTWNVSNYLLDTHTAVAEAVKRKYLTATSDTRKTVVVSTASPFKFCSSVLEALGEHPQGDGVELIDRLAELTGVTPPPQLVALGNAKERFVGACDKNEMARKALDFLENK